MHGTLHCILELDGETIVKCTPVLGYLHCGFEKLGEHRTYNQFVSVVDRMNYFSPLANDISYHLAVEKLFGIEITEKAKVMRTMILEIARIMDHVAQLGMQAVDIGALTPMVWLWKERELLYDIVEELTGTRMTASWTQTGGATRDVPNNAWLQKIRDFTRKFPKRLRDTERLLNKNRIWHDRTRDIGALSQEDAINMGLTGPVLRSTGCDWDLRKDMPFLIYDQLDFDIPVGEKGDVLDRYFVRMYEMHESNKIIRQCVDNMPEGSINIDDPKIIYPQKNLVYTRMEELIHHFKITMLQHGPKPPRGEVYEAIEAPNGELGWYLVSDGGQYPYRVHSRAPSFVNYSSIVPQVEGRMISDIVAIMGSLNIIAGELDR
ncbi:MAG: NADH-quinone oxidoreductase subunit D [Acidobacteria bacterium]|nr:NADH-quinone oxidoreductase subunit D [Acidobacteriota bacterium]